LIWVVVTVTDLQRQKGLDATTRAGIARAATMIAWMRSETDDAERAVIGASPDPAPAARAAYYRLRSWIAARREQILGASP
jgi:hypothetical protein